MAQFNKNAQDFLNQERTLFEVNMIANKNGEVVTETNRFPVSIADTTGGTPTFNTNISAFPDASLAAFEELMVVEPFPIVQIDSSYGLEADKISTVQVGSGTSSFVDTSDYLWTVNSGVATGNLAALRSRRYIRYRPGTGTLARFTAQFTTTGINTSGVGLGVTNTIQNAGMGNFGNGYFFGFSGISTQNQFSIIHRYNGKAEIRRLTITQAPTGIQTANVVLNGTTYSIPIGAGTTSETASTIAEYDYGNVWVADQVGGTVVFTAQTAGVRSGAYSFSATGAGTTATGTFTQINAGQSNTNDYTPQEQWNGTPVSIDPSKLNVYAIDMRWLGAGIVRFFVENPANGKMTLVHTQKWANMHNIPHLSLPSVRLIYAVSVLPGNVPSQSAIIKGASMYGAIQGNIAQTVYSEGWYAVNTGNRTKDIIHHLFSLKNPYTFAGRANTREYILQDLSVSMQGTDPVVIFIYNNPTVATGQILYDTIPDSNALVSTSNSITFGDGVNNPITSFVLGINGTAQFDLMPYRAVISPGDSISIAFVSTNAITRSAISLTWSTD